MPGNNVKSWLYNKYLLFLFVAIATVHLFTLLHTGYFQCAAIFVLSGLVVSFFSKNMIVILVLALAFSGLAGMALKKSAHEGMAEFAEDDSDDGSVEGDETGDSDVHLQSSKATLSQLQNDGKELVGLQQKILSYFKEIAPYMDKAEGLVEKMNEGATTLKNPEVQKTISAIKEKMHKKNSQPKNNVKPTAKPTEKASVKAVGKTHKSKHVA